MIRILSAFFCLLFLSFFLSACGTQGSEDQLKIAFIPKSFTDPFWLDAIVGAELAAEKWGVKLMVNSPSDDTKVVEQVQIVENMIQLGLDGIVLAPSDSDALLSAVLKANAAKIPLSIIDTDVNGGERITFAATDNNLCSSMAVDHLVARLGGKGKIAAISCTQSISTCRDLYNGFVERLKKYPGMELVSTPLGVPFCDKTFDAVTDLLTAHPDLRGIYVFGGPAVLCAVKSAQAFGRKLGTDLFLVGRSSNSRAGAKDLEAVKQGELDAVVVQFPEKMGFFSVESIVNFYKGTSSPAFTNTGTELVTAKNVEEFLAKID